MLAESIHSVADSGNQALLLLGGSRAKRAPTPSHPFGFGRERYFWAFVVAFVLFSLGSAFSIFEGIEKIRHPHEVESAGWAFGVLGVAIVLESLSFRTAIHESLPLKGDAGWWQFIRHSRIPELPVVLLEDLGALVGLVFALGAVALTVVTGNTLWDAIGTLMIGVLLGVIAAILAWEMKSLLIGESATEQKQRSIESTPSTATPKVRRLIHMRTEHIGPEELLVGCKIEFDANLRMDELADRRERRRGRGAGRGARGQDHVPRTRHHHGRPGRRRRSVAGPLIGVSEAQAVTVAGLEKRYGDVEAVKGISFDVGIGECVALLGPNGAGKTTTVEVLEGFRPRDAGRVEVLGFDPATAKREWRARIGIVLQQGGLYNVLTVREVLDLYRSLYPRPRPTEEVLELVGLEEKEDARLRTLSGGQRRRLDLALGIVGDPDLLFLDEPTTGFDPSARRRSWELVQRLRAAGPDHPADHPLHGRGPASGRPGHRAGSAARSWPRARPTRSAAATSAGRSSPSGSPPAPMPASCRRGCPSTSTLGESLVELRTTDATHVLHTLTGWAVERGIDLEALTVTRPSLEDVYLELTSVPSDEVDADE